jgi:L-2,4-diaminobutyrate decarboxylase
MITSAYEHEGFQKAFSTISSEVFKHYASMQTQKGGLPWRAPSELGSLTKDMLNLYQSDLSFDEKLKKISVEFLKNSNRLHSTHYMGHQVAASLPLAGLGEMLGSLTNQATGIYEMGPFSSAAERAMLETLLPFIGWSSPHADGIVTHGGSLANLTGLLVARNIKLSGSWKEGLAQEKSTPVVAVSREAHYCVKRSAAIMGLGDQNILALDTDFKRRIDPTRAREQILRAKKEGKNVFCIVGTAGATPIGSFDPLEDLAGIAKDVGAWLHVDGAHGGSLLLSSQHRGLLRGVEKSDSLVWDAHKMMFVPALSTFLFYKDRASSYRAFQQDAPYLFDSEDQPTLDYDSAVRTVECTKRAMIMGVWTVWSVFGPKLFEQMVNHVCALGRSAYEFLSEQGDFKSLHEPECNILCFQYVPKGFEGESMKEKRSTLQRDIRKHLIQGGKYYISANVLDGEHCLRVVFMNPQATPNDFVELCAEVRKIASSIQL